GGGRGGGGGAWRAVAATVGARGGETADSRGGAPAAFPVAGLGRRDPGRRARGVRRLRRARGRQGGDAQGFTDDRRTPAGGHPTAADPAAGTTAGTVARAGSPGPAGELELAGDGDHADDPLDA